MTAERSDQLNLRLEADLVEELESAAKAESLDRGTMVRRLLREGLTRRRQDRAIAGYQTGRLSLGRAAEEAGVTQWELMDELEARRISHPLRARDVEAWFGDEEGHRTTIDWMGRPVATLSDIPPAAGSILLVGISPIQESIDAGHYYQGRLGRRLWRRLAQAELLTDAIPGLEDDAFHCSGHGLTDVIKRPLADGERPSREELAHGSERLRTNVRRWRPGLVVFVFKMAAEAALEQVVDPGPGPTYEGAQTFILPSPYAKREEADALYEDLSATYQSRIRIVNTEQPS